MLGVLILGACSSGSKVHSHPTDGPVDRQTDMAVDSPPDAATDLPVDSVADASADLPADSVADAGADLPADSVADASTDVQADAVGTDADSFDARMCFTDASTASSCAPTYDDQNAAARARCPSINADRARAGRCGRYLVYMEPFFASPGTTCYYDPTTKAFVAYRNCGDTPGLDGCSCRYAGVAVSPADDCPFLGGGGTPDERQPVCPGDGGAASDARVD